MKEAQEECDDTGNALSVKFESEGSTLTGHIYIPVRYSVLFSRTAALGASDTQVTAAGLRQHAASLPRKLGFPRGIDSHCGHNDLPKGPLRTFHLLDVS